MGRERSVITVFGTNLDGPRAEGSADLRLQAPPTMPAREASEWALSILVHLRPPIDDWWPRAQGCNLLKEPRYLDFTATGMSPFRLQYKREAEMRKEKRSYTIPASPLLHLPPSPHSTMDQPPSMDNTCAAPSSSHFVFTSTVPHFLRFGIVFVGVVAAGV